MPLVVAAFLRQIVMAVASGAVVTGAQNLLDGTFKKLVEELSDTEGLTETEAKDIVGNILLDLAINSTGIMVVLKTGAGVKLAEYLGLTSRKFSKAALTPKAEAAVTKLTADGGKGLIMRVFGGISKSLITLVGGFWLVSSLAQIVEPLWYQPAQIQRVFTALGIDIKVPGAEPTAKPGPFGTDSSVTFADYAASLEAAGVKGINNPITRQSMLYSRDLLAQLVNYVYGQEILAGRAPAVKALIPLISPYLVIPSGSSALPSPAAPVASGGSLPKVYTGIVSQGVIGKGLEFVPRPDDLIESIEELRSAAANNLAPFLQSLTSRIVYEVKIVSSIITKDGFRQTGTAQQVRMGEYSDGRPRYKTVVNRFATLNLYVMTDKNVRSKITTIVLGPTNSAKLTVGQNDLRSLEAALPALTTTTDIAEITGIATNQPVTISNPAAAAAASSANTPGSAVVSGGATPVTPTNSAPIVGASAQTLFEWYVSRGDAMPTVSDRSSIYESLGLGPRAYYTGTAEQNSRLLAALKAQAVAAANPVAKIDPSWTLLKAGDRVPSTYVEVVVDGKRYMYPKPSKSSQTTSSGGSGSAVSSSKETGKSDDGKAPPKPTINYYWEVRAETVKEYEARIEKERQAVRDWEKKYG